MISRKTGQLQFISDLPGGDSCQSCRRQVVFGFLGVLRLLSEAYALVVTSREYVGSYCGSTVYRICSMKFLRCGSESGHLTEIQRSNEAHLRSLLQLLEATPGLYMSYDADLTHSVQASLSLQRNQSLWKQVDSRFVWNKQLWDNLYKMQFDSFALPVIQGSFQTYELELKKTLLKVSLIARRCVRRIGTRMWRRGANSNGDVANFVETEQILQVNGCVASYVQVRGSIPIIWEQVVDLTYKPKIKLANLDETPRVVERHFRELTERYGFVVAVDLVNQHGSEAVLGMAYANAMQTLTTVNANIHYVPFDFHQICGQVKFEKLASLYEDIKDKLSKQGYFLMMDGCDIVEKQIGVVRTNCIDCLDRTNVTQSLLGRKSLEVQLQRLNIFEQSDTIDKFPNLDVKLKTLWADHGDNVSLQYSGTSALKGDFVRFGKRTVHGILKDGYSGLARYYYNNLHDGKRQDALDLAAGHYTASRGFSFREDRTSMKILTYLPLVAAVVFAGLVFTTKSLRNAQQDGYQLLYAFIWGTLTIVITALVRSNGRRFTSRPYLCKLN
ncbi:hypothetical protein GOP47_0022454 [Adiantum capillus-veneris]|uniref:SAC domain-containing protein n=1 Tax=Adiantum capillus-veneris TaxID=13818 RepID=A0A9D4Z5I8_ADICA|nr:hypothetical protein GOP47_0022454 [Adiantum capillus-veneris]